MASYIWDDKKRKWVDRAKYRSPYDAGRGLQVIGDIEPYQSVVTKEVIGGRRQHREHLRQHGLIERGNERMAPRKRIEPEGVGESIKTAMQKLGQM